MPHITALMLATMAETATAVTRPECTTRSGFLLFYAPFKIAPRY